jgi:primary-amine oxidase
MKSFDFLPDLLAEDPEHKQRDDVKPLHVLQPDGVSFKINGHELEWQKWKMHIGTDICNSFAVLD